MQAATLYASGTESFNDLSTSAGFDGATVNVVREYVGVGSRHPRTDLISWLPTVVAPEDFVALKFDVDVGPSIGNSIEWGFLADLYNSSALALVDELFIELHFNSYGPNIPRFRQRIGYPPDWQYMPHTMWQAFDVLRELRACGVAVHAWP